MQIQRPVERGIAAAGDQEVLAAEILHPAHRIVERAALALLRARQRQATRHEAAGARGDHDHRRLEGLPEAGREPPAAVAQTLELLGLLTEMEDRIERPDLLHQEVGQILAGAVRHRRDVVDRLVGIELGALAARPVEVVDQVALDVEQAGLEHREQADRPGADDHHIGPNRVGAERLGADQIGLHHSLVHARRTWGLPDPFATASRPRRRPAAFCDLHAFAGREKGAGRPGRRGLTPRARPARAPARSYRRGNSGQREIHQLPVRRARTDRRTARHPGGGRPGNPR